MNSRPAFLMSINTFLCISACSSGGDDRIATATAIMKRQVASDVSISVDTKYQFLNDPGGTYYYVCGRAKLNQPGLINDEEQKYVITVKREMNGGLAMFDGLTTPQGKAEFAKQWKLKCPPSAL